MQIEAGKYYRTRGGHVFGPMVMDANPEMVYPLRLSAEREAPFWTDKGAWLYGRPSPFDLVAEVYVSDTPPADAPAATPSDDTVVTFNFSQMVRDGSNWTTGSIGFWIGDEMRMANYDVRIGGAEGRASPSDALPTDGTCKFTNCSITTSAPAPETKTLRDEFAMRLMDRGAFAVGYIDEAEQLYRAADAPDGMEGKKDEQEN